MIAAHRRYVFYKRVRRHNRIVGYNQGYGPTRWVCRDDLGLRCCSCWMCSTCHKERKAEKLRQRALIRLRLAIGELLG